MVEGLISEAEGRRHDALWWPCASTRGGTAIRVGERSHVLKAITQELPPFTIQLAPAHGYASFMAEGCIAQRGGHSYPGRMPRFAPRAWSRVRSTQSPRLSQRGHTTPEHRVLPMQSQNQ